MTATGTVAGEQVLLCDEAGSIVGTAPKSSVHHRRTPLHLGFSCYVFDRDGRFLAARRSALKATWPDTWSNSCCGHPAPGETLALAVERRLAAELGITATGIVVVLPWFRYRATMPDGTVEHELCPVLACRTDDEPDPDAGEVGAVEWCDWEEFATRARLRPDSLTPWAVAQVTELGRAGLGDPSGWWARPAPRTGWFALDERLVVRDGAPPSSGRAARR